jgi:competence protein ComK
MGGSKMHIVDDYVLNGKTMALLHEPSNLYQTKIIEENKVVYTKKSSLKLIEEACILGGSTYTGRKNAMKKILRTNSKLPIPINPISGMFFFPSRSPKDINCNWFSFFHINGYTKQDHYTEIKFLDRTNWVADISYKSFNRQYRLAGLVVAHIYKKVLWDLIKAKNFMKDNFKDEDFDS